MCPAGSVVLFQFAVVWQPLQSLVAAKLPVWSDGRPCSAGLAAPMVKLRPASWQVLQEVGTKECLACVMFIGPKVPAAWVLEEWQELQSVPERYGICAGLSIASLGVKLLAQVSAVL